MTTTTMRVNVADKPPPNKVQWSIGDDKIVTGGASSGTGRHNSQIAMLRFLPKTKEGVENAKKAAKIRNRVKDFSRLKSFDTAPSDEELGPVRSSLSETELLGPKTMAGFDYLLAAKRVAKKARKSLHEKKQAHNRREREVSATHLRPRPAAF